MRHVHRLIIVLLVVLSGSGATIPSTHTSMVSLAARPAADVAGESASAPRVTKLLVFVVENHSLSQMRAGMPYTFAQAERFGYATHYRALRHPSLPNYISIISGRPHGVTDDKPPAAHKLHGRTVFGQALRAGKTATVYADGMPRSCARSDGGHRYAVRHNPWTYFVDERAACNRHDVSIQRLSHDITAGRLPNVGMVIPNMCNDAHDCPLTTADDWFRTWMSRIYAGKDWKSGHLAVVLTADEDDRSANNTVLTVVIHPSQHHRIVTTALTHYSLTRLCEDVAHIRHRNQARHAASMSKAFRLPV
ncbi:alkaline phosphatase family protein [Microlunatus ginsengisoli]|uniref:Acid phosphatase n=1 Tax=Microlunatus ginsengisoli TaxID=363863 RepID=A0ABP7AKU9_9ACTN